MSTTTQNLGKVGLVDHGVYSQTKEYNRLDFVTDENNISTYLSLVDKNVGNPLTDTTKWRFLAKGVANTPQEALDLILQADGPGSGLDADTLDGTQLEEIVNPEELASASPFDYFLGAKEVDGKWVFKKMAPTEVATVVAGKILNQRSAIRSWIGDEYRMRLIKVPRTSFAISFEFTSIKPDKGNFRSYATLEFVSGSLKHSKVNNVHGLSYRVNGDEIEIYANNAELMSYAYLALGVNYCNTDVAISTQTSVDSIPSDAIALETNDNDGCFGYKTIEDLSTGVAGLMPLATQSAKGAMAASDKQFIDGILVMPEITESGNPISINIEDAGMYLVNISFRGSDNEHMSTYIFNQSSAYAKKINAIQDFNYKENTSIVVGVNPQGQKGFYFKPSYTSIYNMRVQYRKLMGRV